MMQEYSRGLQLLQGANKTLARTLPEATGDFREATGRVRELKKHNPEDKKQYPEARIQNRECRFMSLITAGTIREPSRDIAECTGDKARGSVN
jgi:hypothetical protein